MDNLMHNTLEEIATWVRTVELPGTQSQQAETETFYEDDTTQEESPRTQKTRYHQGRKVVEAYLTPPPTPPPVALLVQGEVNNEDMTNMSNQSTSMTSPWAAAFMAGTESGHIGSLINWDSSSAKKPRSEIELKEVQEQLEGLIIFKYLTYVRPLHVIAVTEHWPNGAPHEKRPVEQVMNPLGARDSPHPEIVELLTEETSRDTRPSTTEHRNPALGVPRFMRETAATMNRSRMDESHENSAPEQPSRATAPTSQTKETLERRASGLPRAHGKNNLFDRDQPLDISDDSDDELPTTITTRKKGVAFIDHRADLSSPLGIRYPLMSEQRRYSRQSQAEVDTDYFSEAWLSPGPAASLEPLVEHAYERAQFERQPSTSYVIPREDNVTTFDLWENDAQGNPQRKDSLHTTPIGHTNNDQSKALNRLYDQIRDMWRDLGNERKHSDQLGEQLLARDKVIENLHSKDQETQDILEGYKGDVADTQAVLRTARTNFSLPSLHSATRAAHEDYQQAQNQAENLAARKSAYKDKYRQEHDAHRATLENMKKLQAKLKQATAKVSRSARRGHTGPSPDSSDSEGDDANSPLPALSPRVRSPSPPRPKKPEPEAFSGNGTTSADYLKWKMDVTDWFADYPYEFASETKKLSYIRQKTKDKAFGCLQHGYLEPGAEFAHSNEAWSILDSVYKSLNTSIEAQSWYESLNSTMKPTESMGEYIARFNVGTSALRWPDTLKIQFMRNRLPVWWRDMTAMKVLESSLTYLDFCQTLRLLEQSNPQRATTTGNRRGNQSLEAGRLFDSYPEVQDALEKAIANNGVPVGEPARPKVKGAAASVTSTSPQPSENA
ncbi:hypothetical protein A1F94_008417 [Pyrenophora tritici-repentis]|nr:hypothetical protein A1F94_008417 [Pyrenophora tritici-repentis]